MTHTNTYTHIKLLLKFALADKGITRFIHTLASMPMAITCTQMHTRIQYYVYDGYYNCTSFAKDEHLLDEPENKMEVQQSNQIEHEQDTSCRARCSARTGIAPSE